MARPNKKIYHNPSPPKPESIRTGKTALRHFEKDQFEKLCEIQCTKEEICAWFGTVDTTLERWVRREYNNQGFAEVFNQKKGLGKISLRRAQFQMAMKNVPMAIFLGKQWLGQKDSYKVENRESPAITRTPLINWSKFTIAQLEIISKMMEGVEDSGDDESGSRTDSGQFPDAEPSQG